MKKSFNRLVPAAVLFAGVVLACGLPPLVAQVKPAHDSEFVDLDRRVAAVKSPERLAQRNTGINQLKQQLPSANVSFDTLLDTPRFIYSRKGFLTGPNGEGLAVSAPTAQARAANDPYRAVKAFLDEHAALFGHGAEALSGAATTRDSVGAHNGLRTVVWQQQHAGLPVFDAVMLGNITARGELVSLGSHFLPDVAGAAGSVTPAQAEVSSAQAIVAALANLGNTVAPNDVKLGGANGNGYEKFEVQNTAAHARMVWLPLNRSSLRLAWELVLRDLRTRELFQVLVDAQSGDILLRRNLMSHISDATYSVYTSDSPSPFSPSWPTPNTAQPPFTNRVLVTTPALDAIASPNGWINDGDNETQGNNVDTVLDRNFDQQADGPRPQGNPARVFDFPLDLTQAPLSYADAASVQLFYLNNVYHDRMYQLGFTESVGNFQNDNFGRGGLGNDRVISYVQSGADVGIANNAMFGTPPDGISGEMYMFIFDFPTPDRDGDLDAEVVYHEASHGLSQRLVGGGVLINALQSDGMGEGWSDFVSLSLLAEPGDDPDATYSTGGYLTTQLFGLQQNYYFGIRHFPYSTDMTKNPFTFKDIDPSQISPHPGVPRSPIYPFDPLEADEVHHQGEVWCVTLWEARANLIRKHGFPGNQLMLQLVVDGMKLGPANPTFLEARDAILLADLVNNGGVNSAEIWAGFAKRGMGVSAVAPPSDTTLGVVEAFDVPGLQVDETFITGGNGNDVIDVNECNQLDLVLKNNSTTPATGVSVQLSSPTRGVSFGSKTSLYPNVDVGLTATNLTPFSISTSPNFICGTPIVLNVVIKSDQATSQTTLTFPTGTNGPAVQFASITPVVIPDNNPAGTNSTIVVSNVTSAIGKVTVSLYLNHTWDADLTLQLISPDGTTNTLSSGNGFSGDNYGANCIPESFRTIFDDSATVAIRDGIAPFVGRYKPQEPLAVFTGKSGTNVNGTWRLRIVDDARADIGVLNCWTLSISPSVCVDGGGGCPGSDLAVGIQDAPDPVFVGSNLVYTISVTNLGPSLAKNTVVTHQLPPSVLFVSAISSQGTCVNAAGTVVCSLGNVQVDGQATIAVTVLPTVVGTISSGVTITSSETDPDNSNNAANTLTHVNPPTAELSVGLLDAPDPALVGNNLTYTVAVTNGGPSTASGVFVTNTLPPSVIVQSASVGQGAAVINGNVVLFNVGSLTNGARVVGTITVIPTALGSISATSRVSANQADPIVANNTATAVTAVGPAADLLLSLTDNPDPVVVGNNWTYSLGITNLGPSSAENAVINFALPAGITVVSTNSSQGTLSRAGSVITVQLGTLAGGGFAIVTAEVNATNSGLYTANASISSSAADPNTANNNVAAATTVAPPAVVIVPAGATVTAESQSPANGAVDIGETVTLTLRLRNGGNVSNTNDLIATLLATNGVSAPSGPQNYGQLLPSGVPVGNAFTFTASGANGGTVSPTLHLQDGPNDLGLVSFTFNLPVTRTYSNTAGINIADATAASPYPSVINVSGVTGQVGKVVVTLSNLNHTFVEDVDILLVNPSGQKVILMSDAGNPGGVANTTVSFDDSGAALPDNGQILPVTYAPGDFEPGDTFPGPAPVGPYSSSLSAFNDNSPNGAWSLYVVDDFTGDAGSIAGGWSLALTTVTPINQLADVSVSVVAAPTPARVGSPLTYTFTITNSGPVAASGLGFVNTLPAGVTLLAASASQGVVTTNDTAVNVSLGSLAVGTNATVTVSIIPQVAGLLNFAASVTASENDLNTANNTATALTTVNLPVADLAVIQVAPGTVVVNSDATFTIVVTNQGPETALNIQATDVLPSGFTFVSATSSIGVVTNSGNTVTASLGDLAAGSSASVSFVATAGNLGAKTNEFVVTTASSDPNSANNAASGVVQVVAPSPNVVAASALLIAESVSPANLTVENGETVTVQLSLRNIGSANTVNLWAILQPTGGVTAPSVPKEYGILVAGGPAVSRTFSFTASGTNGGVITVSLLLDDQGPLGTVDFTFNLPFTATFANTNKITIPDNGVANPYPSTIDVSGLNGLVSKVTVTLNGLTHGFPDDLDVLVVGPTGQKVVVMSDSGGGSGLTNISLTLDDTAPALPNATPIPAGIRGPADYEEGDVFPPSAPAGPTTAALASFNGADGNGTWSLYVMDDANGDPGIIAGGWALTITTVAPVTSVADLAVTVSDAPDPVFAGSELVYTVTVTNRGPLPATGVSLANDLPLGLGFVSATASQGNVNVVGPHVTATLGNIASGGAATLTLRTVAQIGGTYTNVATVVAAESDLNLVNNTAAAVSTVLVPQPARFSDVVLTNGELQATLTAQPGMDYIVFASADFVTWTPVSTNTVAGNGSAKIFDSNAASYNHRFYRAERQVP